MLIGSHIYILRYSIAFFVLILPRKRTRKYVGLLFILGYHSEVCSCMAKTRPQELLYWWKQPQLRHKHEVWASLQGVLSWEFSYVFCTLHTVAIKDTMTCFLQKDYLGVRYMKQELCSYWWGLNVPHVRDSINEWWENSYDVKPIKALIF